MDLRLLGTLHRVCGSDAHRPPSHISKTVLSTVHVGGPGSFLKYPANFAGASGMAGMGGIVQHLPGDGAADFRILRAFDFQQGVSGVLVNE